MKKIISLIFINFLLYYAAAQIQKIIPPTNYTWGLAHGSSYNEVAYCIKHTSDDGYIAVGYTNRTGTPDGDVTPSSAGNGTTDFWIVKMYSDGSIQYSKAIGGSGNDCAKSVVQLSDGTYMVAGDTHSDNGDVVSTFPPTNDVAWIVHLDDQLNLIGQQVFGGYYTQNTLAQNHVNSIELTSSGDLLVCGYSHAVYSTYPNIFGGGSHGGLDFWVFEIDGTTITNTTWTTNFNFLIGGTGDDIATLCQKSGNNYYLAGYTNSLACSGNITTGVHTSGINDYCWEIYS